MSHLMVVTRLKSKAMQRKGNVPLILEYHVSEETAPYLGELLRFCHFRRYYFELEYDWDKLDYLQKVFAKVAQRLPSDLAAFQAFLGQLRHGE